MAKLISREDLLLRGIYYTYTAMVFEKIITILWHRRSIKGNALRTNLGTLGMLSQGQHK